jgi:hypothetical protein
MGDGRRPSASEAGPDWSAAEETGAKIAWALLKAHEAPTRQPSLEKKQKSLGERQAGNTQRSSSRAEDER